MRISQVTLLIFAIPFLACGDTQGKKIRHFNDPVKKIIIFPNQVYDLSGYAGNGGGNPYNLFDENAFVDPRFEKNTEAFVPVTNCQPTIHPAIYFNRSGGSRIVVDLGIKYSLKEIYFYDRSLVTDSFWIYTGDLRNWKKISAVTTVSQTGGWGWKRIMLDENTRFVMIRFSSFETAITEMVLYGIPDGKIPKVETFSMHKGFTRATLDQFLGVNYITESEPFLMKPFHYSRIYNVALDYDNDTSRNENRVRFNMLHYGHFSPEKGRYIFDIDTLQHVNHGDIWFSIRGVSGWMNSLGFTDKDRPLNRPLLNPEIPGNYSRHAEMMWNMSAFFGYHKVDTQLLSLSNEPRQSGRGSMHIYENGNEEDATWVGNKYCSPFEYFVQSTADLDGDEGRMGKRFGVQSADPGASLMMSGLINLDTNRVRVYRFLCDNLRNDHQFIWQGGIQYHYYALKKGSGISPEEDSLRWKLAKAAEFSYHIAPGVKCFLGENGYDKSPGSWARTPFIPGLSASQSQGIMLLRSINAAFFSGFDAYILYWLRDRNPENDPGVFLTSGIVASLPDGKTKIYPGWYYISTLVNRLGKYRPDKIISENGNVWVYRYRNADHPDSIAYFIYKPTVNGGRVASFTLETSYAVGNPALKISFLDDSDAGREEKIDLKNGSFRFSVEEKPQIILCRDPLRDK
jgi:hypothetical protein